MLEFQRLSQSPALLRKLDPRVALADGRAVDLGRRWEELGCLLEGGITPPRSGATVGDQPIASGDDVVWNFVQPERVREISAELEAISRDEFWSRYHVDDVDTADAPPGERTERLVDEVAYLYRRFEQLRRHYAEAAKRGEGMLVRLGERPYDDAPESLR